MNGITTQIAMQTRLPAEVRGRALAIYTMTSRGLPALGAMGCGLASELIPLRVSLAVASLMVLSLPAFAGRVSIRTGRKRTR